ncbi:MAG: Gmad2 immunoglobulin-like domain-containing protein [Candidatus Paceibacterota bacterium]|jgi:hypothetical protein
MMKKPLISLSDIPDAIMGLCLIFGIGSVFGLLVFASFEIERTKVLEARESTSLEGEYFGNKFILVKTPYKNSTISNPAYVSGMANVYEANVRIRIKEEGNVLADTFLTAEGTADDLYDYNGDIMFSFPEKPNGSIEIFEENPKNGKDTYKVIIPVVFEDHSELIKWNVFSDSANGYSFEHSSELTVITNSEKETVISHKTPYRHANLCINEKNRDINLDDITDFYMSIGYMNDNALNSIRASEDIADLKDEGLEATEFGGKKAYYIDNTESGCGTTDYFMELSKDETIIIKRQTVPEFSKNIGSYSSLKNSIIPANDMISPSKNDYIFDHIVSSIRSIN